MVRDMSVKVRIEVFNALEKIENVSENILLHNLSKKASSEIKELNFPSQYTDRLLSVPASNPSFAFQHGLEDEFNEVREAACRAVRTLAILSADFSNKVMILLMGVLNDDSVAVRLQALDTMHHMAMFGRLKVEEEHLHMILGVLLESHSLIRCTARKVLKVTKFTSLALFKMCVDGLIRDLELYPQDEAEVFSVLFMIGQHHGKFLVDLINQVEKMIEPSSGGKLGYDNARKASYLVLATSAPVSMEQKTCSVPPCLFSYAVTLLGRISRGLADVADQRTFLAYLSYVSRFTFVSKSVFFSNEEHVEKGDMQVPEICEVMKKFRLKEAKSLLLDCHVEQSKEMDSINIILQVVIDVWPSLKLGCTEVTRTLRSLKSELGMLSIQNHGGELMFVLKYIDALEQLGCLWSHFMFSKEFHPGQFGQLERFLINLDRCIRDMRYKFIGLTKEDEFLIFELILANCMLKLSNIQSPANKTVLETVLKKLRSVMSHIEHIFGEGSTELSDFVVRVQKSLSENDANILKISENPYFLWKSLEQFSPRKVFSMGNLKYMEAELQFQGDDFQSPLPFISGLPVGVSLDITLHNISSKNRLWIKLRLEENFTQFVFLDLDVIEGSDQLRKFTFVVPFYRTPKANCFSLTICVVLECMSDDDQLFRSCGGPKHEVVHLCEEKEVYFSVAVR